MVGRSFEEGFDYLQVVEAEREVRLQLASQWINVKASCETEQSPTKR